MKPVSLALAAIIFVLSPALTLGDFVAYSVTDKGKAPLPEAIDSIDAKYLMNLDWGDYSGRRARAGVLEVDNTSSASSFRVSHTAGGVDYSSSSNGVPVNAIEAIVIDSMNRSNRFRLVERTVLSNVLGEQDLASSGRVAKPSGAKTGNVLGAQYLVQVVITDYEAETSGSDKAIGGGLFKKVPLIGGVKLKSETGRVGMNFRLIDAETSEIVYTKQIESLIQESGVAFGGAGLLGDAVLGGFISNYSKTPIGQAVIAGINKGVFELVKKIGSGVPEGSVIKADAAQLYVNLGEDSVSVGERLEVKARGEELIDPDTGISLGGEESYLGDVEVQEVHEKYAIARPVSLTRTPSRGDKVVSTRAPDKMEFASSWSPPHR